MAYATKALGRAGSIVPDQTLAARQQRRVGRPAGERLGGTGKAKGGALVFYKSPGTSHHHSNVALGGGGPGRRARRLLVSQVTTSPARRRRAAGTTYRGETSTETSRQVDPARHWPPPTAPRPRDPANGQPAYARPINPITTSVLQGPSACQRMRGTLPAVERCSQW